MGRGSADRRKTCAKESPSCAKTCIYLATQEMGCWLSCEDAFATCSSCKHYHREHAPRMYEWQRCCLFRIPKRGSCIPEFTEQVHPRQPCDVHAARGGACPGIIGKRERASWVHDGDVAMTFYDTVDEECNGPKRFRPKCGCRACQCHQCISILPLPIPASAPISVPIAIS